MPYKNKQKLYANIRKWKAANPEKLREQGRKYRAANTKKISEYRRQWNAENKEKKRGDWRKWYAAHAERERERVRRKNAEDPEGVRLRGRKYRDANPEKVRMYNHKRRALRKNVVITLTTAEEAEIKLAGCFFADDTCSGPLTIAHDKPVSVGGGTTRGNCFCLCRSHNSRMYTKALAQVIKQLPMLASGK